MSGLTREEFIVKEAIRQFEAIEGEEPSNQDIVAFGHSIFMERMTTGQVSDIRYRLDHPEEVSGTK